MIIAQPVWIEISPFALVVLPCASGQTLQPNAGGTEFMRGRATDFVLAITTALD